MLVEHYHMRAYAEIRLQTELAKAAAVRKRAEMRDQLAMAALPFCLANVVRDYGNITSRLASEAMASAYEMADAMMAVKDAATAEGAPT